MSFFFDLLSDNKYYKIDKKNLKKLKEIKLQYIINNKKYIDFSKILKKKNIIIVNVASKCGFSNQYNELDELQNRFKKNLIVIGIPSDNFLNQEFKDEKETYNFVKKKYNCKLFLTKKMNVKGKNISELYKILRDITNKNISWNFNKILITKDLKVYKFSAVTKPLSNKILMHIKK